MNTLPQWNSEWEKPDPLRGRLGWNRRHYLSVGVAVVLLFTAFSATTPVIVRARQKEAELNRAYKELEAATALGASGTLKP